MKDDQTLHVRLLDSGLQFILRETFEGRRYAFSFIVSLEKLRRAMHPSAQLASLLDYLQYEIDRAIHPRIVDRKGNPVPVIYRNRNSMKPPRENVNRSKETERRRRQMGQPSTITDGVAASQNGESPGSASEILSPDRLNQPPSET